LHPTRTYDFVDGNLITLKKRFEILVKNPHIYETIPIELFVDMKIVQKFVKVSHRIVLEILIPLNVYIEIRLKMKIFT